MQIEARFAGLLIVGLLCIAPVGAYSKSEPEPPTPSAERETTRKSEKNPDAEKPPSATPERAKKPPKAFQPSEKIPADVPSTLPTDI